MCGQMLKGEVYGCHYEDMPVMFSGHGGLLGMLCDSSVHQMRDRQGAE